MSMLDTSATDRATASSAGVPRSVDRLKLFSVCLGIVFMVFWQSPGDTATDTKFDLIVSPWRFLDNATRLWDPITNAGVLQNQAYGYLFPIGPFFGVMHTLGLAPWVIQRSWESAILVVAFLGVVRLTGLLGIPGLWPRVAAGLSYALAPRMLSELSSISSELMPVAALPWVLVPLVRGAMRGSPARAGARSGMALLLAGGVNAGATLAIFPAPALWLITRRRGRRRAVLIRWWVGCTALASLWWAIPLVLLGRYSPPFLDWIENSAVTTQPTSLFANLRGVDHWEAYLGPSVWPAGYILAAAPVVVLATVLVAGFGLAGLARRDVPERTFLWWLLLGGLIMLGAGHAATAGPPMAGQTRDLLDTSLAAFRNIHKFDPLVRLPLAIGIGHLISAVGLPDSVSLPRFAGRAAVPLRRYCSLALVVLGIVAITPALTGQLVSNPRITAEPGWWQQTGTWLAQHSAGERALVVPGSAAPAYLWGKTTDDALQPVATTPWTTRDAVPLTQAGYIRLLDAIEQLLAQGQPSSVLADVLSRSGVGYVVLRNDLNTFTSVSTPTVLVRNALTTSPGFALSASFGPDVGGSSAQNNLLDGGLSKPRPSVEVFSVDRQTPRASLLPAAGAVAANGSSDELPDLLAAGVGAQQAVLFGSDARVLGDSGARLTTVLTDGIRRQQASFANLLAKSVTLAADEVFAGHRRVYDYLPDNAGGVSQYVYSGGLTSVLATSSGAAQYALSNRGDDHGPWSAVDADASTSWRSSSFTGAVGQSITLRFDHPLDLTHIQVSFTSGLGPMPTKVELLTSTGATTADVLPVAGKQTVLTSPGKTTFLTLGIAQVYGDGAGVAVGIDDLRIPGLTPERELQVAGPAVNPDLIRFQVAPGSRSECLPNAGLVYCEAAYGQSGQEDLSLSRQFVIAGGGDYLPSIQVRLRPGAALDQLLSAGDSVVASASSTSSTDPRLRAQAAVDGDPLSYWRAQAGDSLPTLTLRLTRAQPVAGIKLALDPRSAAGRAIQVRFSAGNESVVQALPDDGIVRLPRAVRVDSATVQVLQTQARTDTNSATINTALLPVGIGEATLLTPRPLDGAPPPVISIPCATGPQLEIDGRSVRFRVSAARADVLAGRPVTAIPCAGSSDFSILTGTHQLSSVAAPLFEPFAVSLARDGVGLGASPPGPPATMTIAQWGSVRRVVDVDSPSLSLLAVRENFNRGWQATLGGHRLAPIRVDGWQQGWIVPAGSSGTIGWSFAAQREFGIGLLTGLAAVLALCALSLLVRRSGTLTAAASIAPSWWWRASVVVIASGLLAGLQGIGVGVAAAGGCWFLRRYRSTWTGLLAPSLMLVAGLVVITGPHILLFARSNDAAAQLICVLALAVAALACPDPPRQLDAP